MGKNVVPRFSSIVFNERHNKACLEVLTQLLPRELVQIVKNYSSVHLGLRIKNELVLELAARSNKPITISDARLLEIISTAQVERSEDSGLEFINNEDESIVTKHVKSFDLFGGNNELDLHSVSADIILSIKADQKTIFIIGNQFMTRTEQFELHVKPALIVPCIVYHQKLRSTKPCRITITYIRVLGPAYSELLYLSNKSQKVEVGDKGFCYYRGLLLNWHARDACF